MVVERGAVGDGRGAALTVEWVASTVGALEGHRRCLGQRHVGVSEVSTAVSVTDSATVSVTVKVVCPLLSVTAGDGPLTFAVDDGDVKVTALPATGNPERSPPSKRHRHG